MFSAVFTVELLFRSDLACFLRRGLRGEPLVRRTLKENTSINDVIEACGVPHTEVDLIVAAGDMADAPQAVDFSWTIEAPARVEIFAAPAPDDLFPEARRLQVPHWTRFVADGHLGKLARNLRLLGLNVIYERDAGDRRLLEIMVNEDRALLTRDRRLLMHAVVRHGYCPRSADGEEQTREVLRRFSLGLGGHAAGEVALHSRCLRCNSRLNPVTKEEVLAPLAAEPLTLRYYESFRRC